MICLAPRAREEIVRPRRPTDPLGRPLGSTARGLIMSDSPFPDDRRPRLFLYSLLLPALWFGTGFLMLEFFPSKRLGLEGLILILFAMVWIISWHFAKNFRRHFSKSERLRLIIYCVCWAAVAELLAIYSAVSDR